MFIFLKLIFFLFRSQNSYQRLCDEHLLLLPHIYFDKKIFLTSYFSLCMVLGRTTLAFVVYLNFKGHAIIKYFQVCIEMADDFLFFLK